MSEKAVLKFGGTSAADPERIARIFTGYPERNRVAVMSAIGKNFGDNNGTPKITDKLLDLEQAVDREDEAGITEAQDFVIERTCQVYGCLGTTALSETRDTMYKLLQPEHRNNRFVWVGEHIGARLFAQLTGAEYVKTGLLFSNGQLVLGKSISSILDSTGQVLASGRQMVTEGFFGFDINSGRIDVLPRGGSDTTGVIYAGALSSSLNGSKWINENYTDKDGLFSADPDLVANATVIPEITHEEVREKMHGIIERNGPIHGDAVAYASRLGTEVIIKNSYNTKAPGTRIVPTRVSDPDRPIIGITGKSNMVCLDAFDMGMADAKNYLAAILTRIGELGVSISNVPTGEDRIKLVFNSGVSSDQLRSIEKFILERAVSGSKAQVSVTKDEGSVYLIGQELTKPITYTHTIGRVATILSAAGLPMREVISHEKSPSLALTVAGLDVRTIIQLLHKELIES